MIARRLSILVIAAGVVAMTVWFWQDDLVTIGVLLAVDLFLGFLLLSGWRQLTQQARDQESIAAHRAAQRAHASEVQRENRRDVATPMPPATDDAHD